MKKHVFVLLLCIVPAPLPAKAGVSVGFGVGNLGTGRIEDQRIGPAIRDQLQDYLKKEYARQCPAKKKKLPEICQHTTALYSGITLPAGAGAPLSDEAARRAGFVLPGTTYVQSGFVIYLISWPRRTIVDSVTPFSR